jgi:hypothetical protein
MGRFWRIVLKDSRHPDLSLRSANRLQKERIGMVDRYNKARAAGMVHSYSKSSRRTSKLD